MNIIIITAMFPPIRTGTSFYSANLSKALSDMGHNVTVITLKNIQDADEQTLRNYNVERVPAFHVPVKNFLKHFRLCSILPLNYFKINKIVRNAEADVILLVNHYLDIAFPAIVSSVFNKIPISCSVGTQLQSCNPVRNKILNLLDRFICGNIIFPFCTKIIAWDNEIRRYLDDIHGDKFYEKYALVNYGINGNANIFISHNHDYSMHNQILGIGAVSEQRNFIPLVRAFSKIASDFPKLRLKIIGHVYYDVAVKLVYDLGLDDRVIFTGELSHEQVMDELKHSDVYFGSLTAKYVGLGTATIESMLMGIPTIANVPSNLLGKAVLNDMEHIVLLNNIDPEIISDKLRLLIKDQALRGRIGAGGRDFIVKNMSWNKIAHDMSALLNAVANAHHKDKP